MGNSGGAAPESLAGRDRALANEDRTEPNPPPLPRSYRLDHKIDVLRRKIQSQTIKGTLTAELWARRLSGRILQFALNWAATLLSILIVGILLAFGDFGPDTKASETNLAAGQIIGAALALVLSLSIIPAQRAAELFSIAVLKFFANDPILRSAFLVLVFTTMASLLLGSGWTKIIGAQVSLSLQFILLGVSFDTLRIFYVSTLDLLAPESAIRRVVQESKKYLKSLGRVADKIVAIQVAATGEASDTDRMIHAQTITASDLPRILQRWTSQLEEFAHRFIARRDSNATIEAVDAIETIAREYADLRKKSITLHIDPQFPFAGPRSDISDVLNPVYESVLRIIDDAISSKNERVVQHSIDSMGRMALHAMSIVTKGTGGQRVAPLTYAALFYFGRATRSALAANMLDATLHGIAALQRILLGRPMDVDLTGVVEEANETLFAIAADGYLKSNPVSVFRSVEAMLLSIKYEILRGDFEENSLRSTLRRILQMIPFEVSADAAGNRRLQTFPAYSLGFEACIPMLLQDVAGKVQVDSERPEIDPFNELEDAVEIIRDHYRSLCKIDFKQTLLLKWTIDSLDAVLRVLFHQIIHPPKGAEAFVSTVVTVLMPQITWMSGFFPKDTSASKQHVRDATASLTILGIDALDHGWFNIAKTCAETLHNIATNLEGTLNAYELADIHKDMEVLARAAEVVEHRKIAADIRSWMTLPGGLTPEMQKHYLDARQTRLRHLDEAFADAGRRPYRRDDPIERLYSLVHKPKQNG
jgi:hypothetical protein